jgi:hypothetical protein
MAPLLFLSLFLIPACSTVKVTKAPDLSCSPTITLTKQPGDVSAATRFPADIQQVAAFVDCKNISGRHSLRWEWFSPDQMPYMISDPLPILSSGDRYIPETRTFHAINIKGEKAASLEGDWQVQVFLDDTRIASQSFSISKPPELLPNSMDERGANFPGVVK